MAIDINMRAQLGVVIPRIQYAIGALLAATTTVLLDLWMIKHP
jgi:hypothetical protein